MENASKALIIAGAILISILLISIGIMLINSGRSVSETGAASMDSYKLQTFNSKFTMFEGDSKKGSDIKDVFNTVAASNASDVEHQVEIKLVTPVGGSDKTMYYPKGTHAEDECSAADLSMTGQYKVTCNYTDGFVTEIEIDKI